jgi:hypothetical protein
VTPFFRVVVAGDFEKDTTNGRFAQPLLDYTEGPTCRMPRLGKPGHTQLRMSVKRRASLAQLASVDSQPAALASRSAVQSRSFL